MEASGLRWGGLEKGWGGVGRRALLVGLGMKGWVWGAEPGVGRRGWVQGSALAQTPVWDSGFGAQHCAQIPV